MNHRNFERILHSCASAPSMPLSASSTSISRPLWGCLVDVGRHDQYIELAGRVALRLEALLLSQSMLCIDVVSRFSPFGESRTLVGV